MIPKPLDVYVSMMTNSAGKIVSILVFSSPVHYSSFIILEMVLINGIPFIFTTSMLMTITGSCCRIYGGTDVMVCSFSTTGMPLVLFVLLSLETFSLGCVLVGTL